MAQIKLFYEPEMELLTLFWQKPRENQICEEVSNGIIIIKDEKSHDPIGIELLSFKPADFNFNSIGLEVGVKNSSTSLGT
jgi:hypothetical protein